MNPRDEIEPNPIAQAQREATHYAKIVVFGPPESWKSDQTALTVHSQVAVFIDTAIERALAEGLRFSGWNARQVALKYAEQTIFRMPGVHHHDYLKEVGKRKFNVSPIDIENVMRKLFAEIYASQLPAAAEEPDPAEASLASQPLERQLQFYGLVGLATHLEEIAYRLPRAKTAEDRDELLDVKNETSQAYVELLEAAKPSPDEQSLLHAIVSRRAQRFGELHGLIADLSDAVDEHLT